MDPTLNVKEQTYTHDAGDPSPTLKLKLNNGLSIWITRIPLAESDQLSVFINTEDMGETDHFEGTPELQVCLNDATLYDCEPYTKGEDKTPNSIMNAAVAVLDSEGGIASMGELAAAVKVAGGGDFTDMFPVIA